MQGGALAMAGSAAAGASYFSGKNVMVQVEAAEQGRAVSYRTGASPLAPSVRN
jgi:hypothetical protein